MKQNLRSILILVACATLFATTGLISAQSIKTPATNPPAKLHEPHPAIQTAIHALERARTELEDPNCDFGGRRMRALEATDKAIKELRTALLHDKV